MLGRDVRDGKLQEIGVGFSRGSEPLNSRSRTVEVLEFKGSDPLEKSGANGSNGLGGLNELPRSSGDDHLAVILSAEGAQQ
jgi:hypothetical protein